MGDCVLMTTPPNNELDRQPADGVETTSSTNITDETGSINPSSDSRPKSKPNSTSSESNPIVSDATALVDVEAPLRRSKRGKGTKVQQNQTGLGYGNTDNCASNGSSNAPMSSNCFASDERVSSCVVNGVGYKIGDFIYFEEADFEYFTIGQLEEIKLSRRDKFALTVKCFYRSCDIPETAKHCVLERELFYSPSSANVKTQVLTRELFASEVQDTLTSKQLRGQCKVSHLSDLRTALQIFNPTLEDNFFYVFAYNPETRRLLHTRAEIRVGYAFQASIPSYRHSPPATYHSHQRQWCSKHRRRLGHMKTKREFDKHNFLTDSFKQTNDIKIHSTADSLAHLSTIGENLRTTSDPLNLNATDHLPKLGDSDTSPPLSHSIKPESASFHRRRRRRYGRRFESIIWRPQNLTKALLGISNWSDLSTNTEQLTDGKDVTDEPLKTYLDAVRSMVAFFGFGGADDDLSSAENGLVLANLSTTTQHAYDTLHHANYSLKTALENVSSNPIPSKNTPRHWTVEQVRLFAHALRIHGKDFHAIQRDFFGGNTCTDHGSSLPTNALMLDSIVTSNRTRGRGRRKACPAVMSTSRSSSNMLQDGGQDVDPPDDGINEDVPQSAADDTAEQNGFRDATTTLSACNTIKTVKELIAFYYYWKRKGAAASLSSIQHIGGGGGIGGTLSSSAFNFSAAVAAANVDPQLGQNAPPVSNGMGTSNFTNSQVSFSGVGRKRKQTSRGNALSKQAVLGIIEGRKTAEGLLEQKLALKWPHGSAELNARTATPTSEQSESTGVAEPSLPESECEDAASANDVKETVQNDEPAVADTADTTELNMDSTPSTVDGSGTIPLSGRLRRRLCRNCSKELTSPDEISPSTATGQLRSLCHGCRVYLQKYGELKVFGPPNGPADDLSMQKDGPFSSNQKCVDSPTKTTQQGSIRPFLSPLASPYLNPWCPLSSQSGSNYSFDPYSSPTGSGASSTPHSPNSSSDASSCTCDSDPGLGNHPPHLSLHPSTVNHHHFLHHPKSSPRAIKRRCLTPKQEMNTPNIPVGTEPREARCPTPEHGKFNPEECEQMYTDVVSSANTKINQLSGIVDVGICSAPTTADDTVEEVSDVEPNALLSAPQMSPIPCANEIHRSPWSSLQRIWDRTMTVTSPNDESLQRVVNVDSCARTDVIYKGRPISGAELESARQLLYTQHVSTATGPGLLHLEDPSPSFEQIHPGSHSRMPVSEECPMTCQSITDPCALNLSSKLPRSSPPSLVRLSVDQTPLHAFGSNATSSSYDSSTTQQQIRAAFEQAMSLNRPLPHQQHPHFSPAREPQLKHAVAPLSINVSSDRGVPPPMKTTPGGVKSTYGPPSNQWSTTRQAAVAGTFYPPPLVTGLNMASPTGRSVHHPATSSSTSGSSPHLQPPNCLPFSPVPHPLLMNLFMNMANNTLSNTTSASMPSVSHSTLSCSAPSPIDALWKNPEFIQRQLAMMGLIPPTDQAPLNQIDPREAEWLRRLLTDKLSNPFRPTPSSQAGIDPQQQHELLTIAAATEMLLRNRDVRQHPDPFFSNHLADPSPLHPLTGALTSAVNSISTRPTASIQGPHFRIPAVSTHLTSASSVSSSTTPNRLVYGPSEMNIAPNLLFPTPPMAHLNSAARASSDYSPHHSFPQPPTTAKFNNSSGMAPSPSHSSHPSSSSARPAGTCSFQQQQQQQMHEQMINAVRMAMLSGSFHSDPQKALAFAAAMTEMANHEKTHPISLTQPPAQLRTTSNPFLPTSTPVLAPPFDPRLSSIGNVGALSDHHHHRSPAHHNLPSLDRRQSGSSAHAASNTFPPLIAQAAPTNRFQHTSRHSTTSTSVIPGTTAVPNRFPSNSLTHPMNNEHLAQFAQFFQAAGLNSGLPLHDPTALNAFTLAAAAAYAASSQPGQPQRHPPSSSSSSSRSPVSFNSSNLNDSLMDRLRLPSTGPHQSIDPRVFGLPQHHAAALAAMKFAQRFPPPPHR